MEEKLTLSPNAGEKRRREFALGRVAAHRAIAALGGDPMAPISREKSREPIWPAGFVGSIAHSNEFAAALVAKSEATKSLGLDIQRISTRLSEKMVDRIAVESERPWIFEEPSLRLLRFTLLFSAKESVYKALFPIYKRYIGYHEAILSWDAKHESFDVSLDPKLSGVFGAGFAIVTQRVGDYVLTATRIGVQ